MIEIGTSASPGSSYYLDYDNPTFALTVTAPVMKGWIEQWNLYVPVVRNCEPSTNIVSGNEAASNRPAMKLRPPFEKAGRAVPGEPRSR